jgi:AcrB/AcrD/AcrF family protein
MLQSGLLADLRHQVFLSPISSGNAHRNQPRFATVINIFIFVFGLVAASFLPVAQYPNIVPPTVKITALLNNQCAAAQVAGFHAVCLKNLRFGQCRSQPSN